MKKLLILVSCLWWASLMALPVKGSAHTLDVTNFGLIITVGEDLLRINSSKNVIEYSPTGGRTWFRRFSGTSSTGNFIDFIVYGNEILASTTKGVYFSKDKGRTWFIRSSINSNRGEFSSLQANGNEVLGVSSKGVFYSKDAGRTWFKRSN